MAPSEFLEAGSTVCSSVLEQSPGRNILLYAFHYPEGAGAGLASDTTKEISRLQGL